MDEKYSEDYLRAHCPFCDPQESWAFDRKLEEFTHFHLICDVHPLMEGHLLLIPKRHVSCIGEYSAEEWEEFLILYESIKKWVETQYGSVATFEHGRIGQTVFHSHIHFLPFACQPGQIIPEGSQHLHSLSSLQDLVPLFQKEAKYLFFSIGADMWTVDPLLGAPRFFRDRFAAALGCPEKGNWKITRANPTLVASDQEINKRCQRRYAQING